jgi:transcriptional/translational regulatory protein YebC/TACO1
MGVFRLDPEGMDPEALELDLIDFGLEEKGEGTGEKEEPQLVIRCSFPDFGLMQRALEDRGITPISAEIDYIPLNVLQLSEEAATEVLEMVDRIEQDDDVQKVFHNLG